MVSNEAVVDEIINLISPEYHDYGYKISSDLLKHGYEINPDLIKKPALCLTCLRNYEPGPEDEMLCNLNRYDQRDKDKFVCGVFEKL